MLKRKKKKLEQEQIDKDFGYDGYYNDVEPIDINEQSKDKKENSSTAIKVGALIFGTLLVISFIVVLMVAF